MLFSILGAFHTILDMEEFSFSSPGVAVSAQQTGLELGESQAQLGLQPNQVLDQLAFVAQVDPEALQVLLHHLLELHYSLLNVQAWMVTSRTSDS